VQEHQHRALAAGVLVIDARSPPSPWEVASTNDHLRQTTADVFTDWLDRGTALFLRHGLDEPTARRLTISLVAALEGAFVLARALRNTEPLYAEGTAVAIATRQALQEATEAR
jgi:hypothetical protein